MSDVGDCVGGKRRVEINRMLGLISRAPVNFQLQYASRTFSLRAPGGLTGDGARTLSPIARPI